MFFFHHSSPPDAGCNIVNTCHHHADCVFDTVALTHRCQCRSGYEGDGTICTEIQVKFYRFCILLLANVLVNWVNVLVNWVNVLVNWVNVLVNWVNVLVNWVNVLVNWVNVLVN